MNGYTTAIFRCGVCALVLRRSRLSAACITLPYASPTSMGTVGMLSSAAHSGCGAHWTSGLKSLYKLFLTFLALPGGHCQARSTRGR